MIVATHSTRSATQKFSRFLRTTFFALVGATLMLPACSWQKAQWQSGWNPGTRMSGGSWAAAETADDRQHIRVTMSERNMSVCIAIG